MSDKVDVARLRNIVKTGYWATRDQVREVLDALPTLLDVYEFVGRSVLRGPIAPHEQESIALAQQAGLAHDLAVRCGELRKRIAELDRLLRARQPAAETRDRRPSRDMEFAASECRRFLTWLQTRTDLDPKEMAGRRWSLEVLEFQFTEYAHKATITTATDAPPAVGVHAESPGEVCPGCNGTGTVRGMPVVDYEVHPDAKDVACAGCCGTGRVPVDAAEPGKGPP